MRVGGVSYRTIWLAGDACSIEIIDQTRLPHEFVTTTLASLADVAHAIRSMQVRGAPLIGVTAAYGVCLQLLEDASDASLDRACNELLATRPTAVSASPYICSCPGTWRPLIRPWSSFLMQGRSGCGPSTTFRPWDSTT